MANPIKLGISIGDVNGVGLEVIIKALSHPKILDMCTPILYGNAKVVSYHKNIVEDVDFRFVSLRDINECKESKINVVNCWNDKVNIELGSVSEQGGKYAYMSLDAAARDLKEGKIDALVTAPIHKHAMQLANFPHPGHTEFLTKVFNSDSSLMMMVHEDLRIATVTNHLPIRRVQEKIKANQIRRKLEVFNHSLRQDFGIEKPIIAVLGLNPHAGDNGSIGKEEINEIRPAVEAMKAEGHLIMGPFPADGFFASGTYRNYDGILAMYHDQGLIPFKILSGQRGVNFTAGLPMVRTSPDHGTAMDLAGKNMASSDSMQQAIFRAVELTRARKEYFDDRANAVKHNELEDEEVIE